MYLWKLYDMSSPYIPRQIVDPLQGYHQGPYLIQHLRMDVSSCPWTSITSGAVNYKRHWSMAKLSCKVYPIIFLCSLCCYGLILCQHLTQWGTVTHTCVSKLCIIASDNGLSPGRRQSIIGINAGILLFQWNLKWNSYIFIQENAFENVADISQTTLSNASSWMKMLEFQLKFHWSLFLRVQ